MVLDSRLNGPRPYFIGLGNQVRVQDHFFMILILSWPCQGHLVFTLIQPSSQIRQQLWLLLKKNGIHYILSFNVKLKAISNIRTEPYNLIAWRECWSRNTYLLTSHHQKQDGLQKVWWILYSWFSSITIRCCTYRCIVYVTWITVRLIDFTFKEGNCHYTKMNRLLVDCNMMNRI